MACLFGHKWDGCKCSKCGYVRNENHKWNGCICSNCRITRDEKHDWNGCKCSLCNEIRNTGHKYEKVEHKCIERCTICGKEKEVHAFIKETIENDKTFCYMLKCEICGKSEKKEHTFRSTSRGIGKALLTCECGSKKIEPHEHSFWCNQCDYCGEYEKGVRQNGDFYLFEKIGLLYLVGYGGKGNSKLVIPEGVTNISMGHLGEIARNNEIIEVIFPSTLTNTGMHTFNYCKNLRKVVMNEGLIAIAQSVFSGCSSLEEINIPGTVKNIETLAFGDCESLKSIYLPSSVINFDYNPFAGCKDLVISCHEDSAAYRFAEKEKIPYKLLPKETA